jgi:hypothetical protein
MLHIPVEVIGLAARIDSHNHTDKLIPYCIQSVFILLGPALFAASVYMVLARIIQSVHGEKYSIVPLKWLTKTFITCDIATFVLQAAASGMMVSSSLASIGKGVVITGLALQVVSFSLFVVTAYIFLIKMRGNPTPEVLEGCIPWKQHLKSLYSISTLILMRSIFRVIEYAMGDNGYPLKHEWTLYVFDSVPMFTSMVMFGVWHPSALKPFLGQQVPSNSETIEMKDQLKSTSQTFEC